jgi:hypothetical protein
MPAYRRRDGVLCEVLEGKAVLVTPAGNEVLTLNRVGTLVWDALGEPRDADQVVEQLAGEFPDAPRARIAADVDAFLTELEVAGLVTVLTN